MEPYIYIFIYINIDTRVQQSIFHVNNPNIKNMFDLYSYVNSLDAENQDSFRHIVFVNGMEIGWDSEHPCIHAKCGECFQHVYPQFVQKGICNHCDCELSLLSAHKLFLSMTFQCVDPTCRNKGKLEGYASHELSIAMAREKYFSNIKTGSDFALVYNNRKRPKVTLTHNKYVTNVKVVIRRHRKGGRLIVEFETEDE